MLKPLFLTLFIFFSLPGPLFSLDWIRLHEKADNQSLESALEESRSDSSSMENLYVLGLVYFNLHRDSEAKTAFSEILNRNPGIIEAQWGIAEALRRQHKIEEAKVILNKVIMDNPEFSPAYISLAYIKYILMDFNGSVRLSLEIIQRGRERSDLSNFTRAYSMYAGAKGMIAHYGGLLSKAVNGLAVKPNLEKAFKLQPNSAAVLFGLGSYYFLAPVLAGGDKNKAQDYLKRAIEADPLFTDAYVRLAQLYKIRGDNEGYEFYIDKAFRLDPENILLLDHKSGRCKFICIGGEEKVKP